MTRYSFFELTELELMKLPATSLDIQTLKLRELKHKLIIREALFSCWCCCLRSICVYCIPYEYDESSKINRTGACSEYIYVEMYVMHF